MVDLPPPPPAPAAWFGLGLILGIIISLTTGEGRVEEIFLGTGGGLIELSYGKSDSGYKRKRRPG